MSQPIILVAGATGELGGRIVRALLKKKVAVRAVVRASGNLEMIRKLETDGAEVIRVSQWNVDELSKACAGITCVVSALAGLREVVIDAQKTLLDAAVGAGVPRFIPSDFSLDFTKFQPGENRNFDLRREFHLYLDKQPIASTSIFNGAFMELLTGNMPAILFKQKTVLYWGKADKAWQFTTMDDTAAYTANVAVDDSAPRYLHIAGDLKSPEELRQVVSKLTGQRFRLIRAGGQGLLKMLIRLAKTFAPGKNELYPAWQGMQYMNNMVDDRSAILQLDNDRYGTRGWTGVTELLQEHLKS